MWDRGDRAARWDHQENKDLVEIEERRARREVQVLVAETVSREPRETPALRDHRAQTDPRASAETSRLRWPVDLMIKQEELRWE